MAKSDTQLQEKSDTQLQEKSGAQLKGEVLKTVKYEALESCFERYDLVPKIIGGCLIMFGGPVLQVFLPGVGQWIAFALGGVIPAAAGLTAAQEGNRIEAGDLATTERYLSDQRATALLKLYTDEIIRRKGAKSGASSAPANSSGSSDGGGKKIDAGKKHQPRTQEVTAKSDSQRETGSNTKEADITTTDTAGDLQGIEALLGEHPDYISQPLPEADNPLGLPEYNPLDMVGYPISHICGESGSGKTTLCQWIAYEASSIGYEVIIADPHYAKGGWPGLRVVGKAKNYDECDKLLSDIINVNNRRYEELCEQGEQDWQHILLILDEFTNWSKHCDNTADFIEIGLTDFRKVNLHCLIVSHSNNIDSIGGIKNNKAKFENTVVRLSPSAAPAQIGNKYLPRPTGLGILTVNGNCRGRVVLPNLKGWTPLIGEPEAVVVKAEVVEEVEAEVAEQSQPTKTLGEKIYTALQRRPDGLSMRELMRACKGHKGLENDQLKNAIQACLDDLISSGYVENFRGDRGGHKWRVAQSTV